jgi:cytochrome c553
MLLCFFMRLLLALALCWASAAAAAPSTPLTAAPSTPPGVPDWLFPPGRPPSGAAPADNVKLIHVPNSEAAFTAAQLTNLFFVPDWHPATHGPMPEVVAHGRPPSVFACGYCHMPTGQGRPENAPLAGLPAQYIIQQIADFKSGARRGAPQDYLPSAAMVQIARNLSPTDLSAAADYFAAQRITRRTRVVETARVPKTNAVGWIYVAEAKGATEPLGQRLLEMTHDLELHERRADGLLYVAYVPFGSIGRGKSLAQPAASSTHAAGTLAQAAGTGCIACHGEGLHGVGLVPPLAGRSPTYILRQLVAFKTGARAGPAGEPMKAVVANMKLNNMIDAAAYASSLQP